MYRRLFFFWRVAGIFGLWSAYVIDKASDRRRSGEGLLSINERNADKQGWRDSSVSSPPFKVSSNFLLTPGLVSLNNKNGSVTRKHTYAYD